MRSARRKLDGRTSSQTGGAEKGRTSRAGLGERAEQRLDGRSSRIPVLCLHGFQVKLTGRLDRAVVNQVPQLRRRHGMTYTDSSIELGTRDVSPPVTFETLSANPHPAGDEAGGVEVIDMNGKSVQKPKRKKHRPKVIKEGQSAKLQKPKTPKPPKEKGNQATEKRNSAFMAVAAKFPAKIEVPVKPVAEMSHTPELKDSCSGLFGDSITLQGKLSIEEISDVRSLVTTEENEEKVLQGVASDSTQKFSDTQKGPSEVSQDGTKAKKEFLDRLVTDHGSIDLEWLRDVQPDKAKDYLLSIRGLGLKSVECVRLLTLHHMAFPVDTNVGRICVRLGWVPLQPLPESLQLHLLEMFFAQKPIIEEPLSPEPEPENTETKEGAIEDFFCEDPDEIPTINLNIEEFTQNLKSYMQANNMEIEDADMSKALVAITPEAASIPTPKLKNL
nr:unnamed protein product [Digitaria exilis]